MPDQGITPANPAAAWDNVQAPLYKHYEIDNTWTLAEGLAVLPLAETPPTDPAELAAWSPVAVVRLHAPYRLRRASFSTKKDNNPPVIPTPASCGAFTFVGGTVSIPVPQLTADLDKFLWSAAGEYTFVEACVSRPQDGFVLGMQPWIYASQVRNFDKFGGGLTSVGTGAILGALASLTTYGAAGQGGFDTRLSATMASQYNFNSVDTVSITCPSLFPGSFLNGTILNGGPQLGAATTTSSAT